MARASVRGFARNINDYGDKIRGELAVSANKIGRGLVQNMAAVTATWQHHVKFDYRVDIGGDSLNVFVGTDDEIFGYVENGTVPHVIAARNAPYLAFRSGHIPKTRPGVLGSGRGRRFGRYIRKRQVMHPGNKPRHFLKTLLQRRQSAISIEMQAAVTRGLK